MCCCPVLLVGLFAAKGKEGFYEKYGFMKRPNETYGNGMCTFFNTAAFPEKLLTVPRKLPCASQQFVRTRNEIRESRGEE